MRPEGLDADEELQRRERLWAEVKEKMAVTVPEYQTRAQVDEMNARIYGNLEDVLGGEKAQQVSATPEAVQTSPRDDHEVNLDLTRFLAREREAPSDVQITATEEVVEQSPRLHRKVKQDLTSFLEECWREREARRNASPVIQLAGPPGFTLSKHQKQKNRLTLRDLPLIPTRPPDFALSKHQTRTNQLALRGLLLRVVGG